jgi:hypothetical protein
MADASPIRSVPPTPAPQAATSALSLTVARMERTVDLIEERLRRLETSHRSLNI